MRLAPSPVEHKEGLALSPLRERKGWLAPNHFENKVRLAPNASENKEGLVLSPVEKYKGWLQTVLNIR